MKAVIVFTKVPERGHVKTRLQKKYSAYHVEQLYIAFLEDTLQKLREYFPYVAYYPPDKLQPLWMLLGERKYIQQRGKDMGDKLLNAFRDFYRMGIKDVMVVGCDVPTLKTEHIEEAFELMDEHDLVFGPSNDGGFYLVGGRGLREEVFEGVNWEGSDILERVLSNAQNQGFKCATLPKLIDIDTPEDLEVLRRSDELDKASHTYQALKKMH